MNYILLLITSNITLNKINNIHLNLFKEDQHNLHSEEVDDDYENVTFSKFDKEAHHTIGKLRSSSKFIFAA